MKAGECWAFDSFCVHNVRNLGTEKRVHLVLDTVGGEKLWDMMVETRRAEGQESLLKFVAPGSTSVDEIAFERINAPEIMSAWEVRCHIDFLVRHAPQAPQLPAVVDTLDRFATAWAAAWAQFGPSPEGLGRYQQLITDIRVDLKRIAADRILLHNAVPLDRALNELIFMVATPAAPARAVSPGSLYAANA
jgi:hypothetical protein